MVKDSSYNMTQLKKDFGLLTQAVWYEALDQAPIRRVEYIRKMRSNNEQLNKKPRILLSTIHGVKGGEEQNVVLLSDLSLNTQKGYERNPDDENRLFYVGATRTKEHLHIVEPKNFYKSYPI
jgi:superfamily I DNA/RNA helicase